MSSNTSLDIRAIKEILPHRYPALLLDKVLQIEPRKYIVGIKNVTINEPIFQGHFSDNPILPGVLILESLGDRNFASFCKIYSSTGDL